MPIYPRFSKRKDGYVYDVVVSQGRKRVWHRGIDTELEAKRLETKLEAKRDQGESVAQLAVTVEFYLEEWLRDYAAALPGKQTATTYGVNLRTHVIPFLGRKRLKDLTPKDVNDRITAIGKIRSQKTALNVFRVLSEAIAHAVRLEVINRNVCDKVEAPIPPRYRVKARSIEEINTVLDASDVTQYGALCRVCVWTGLRQGELIALQWSDLDLDAAVLYVTDAKWGSAGALVLSEECVSLLRAHGVAEEMKLRAFGPNFVRGPWVFTNSVGGQVDAGGLKRTWRRIREKSGVDMRFHDLRHAHASLLVRGGVHAKVIQERLRHKQISTTMDIYGHLMPGLQEAAARTISEAMKAPMKPHE